MKWPIPTEIVYLPEIRCRCGAVLASWTLDDTGHAFTVEQMPWQCSRLLTGQVRVGERHEWTTPPRDQPEPAAQPPSVFDPGDVVEIRPDALPQPIPVSWLSRAGVDAWSPELTIERVRPLGDGRFALTFDGMPGQWLSTGFRRVDASRERVIGGTPPPRRPKKVETLRLYSHAEILREAGAVLTTADFDRLVDRLEAL